MRGRVLAEPPVRLGAWVRGRLPSTRVHDLSYMIARFTTFEVTGAEVTVHLGDAKAAGQTDNGGYFDIELSPDCAGHGWVTAYATLGTSPGTKFPIEVLIVPSETYRMVISDIDDTVLLNGEGNTLRTVWTTFAGTALSRRATMGASDLYRSLTRPSPATNGTPSPLTPLFFVSSSPRNLYDFLVEFLAINRFPRAPLLLRDIGLNRATLGASAHESQKVNAITEILQRLPNPTVVLIGDTSQSDPRAFARVMAAHPYRVMAAFVRDVSNGQRDLEVRTLGDALPASAGVLRTVQDLGEVETYLAQLGW